MITAITAPSPEDAMNLHSAYLCMKGTWKNFGGLMLDC